MIDDSLQIFGGLVVECDVPLDRLSREIRALQKYEGAKEVQKLIIVCELLMDAAAKATP